MGPVRQTKIKLRYKIILFIVVAIDAAYLFLRFWPYPIFAPGNLGPQLQYVGTRNYGCIFPIPCDSGPDTEYYFASDMTPEQLAAYFKHASCRRRENSDTGNNDYTGYYIDCSNSNKTFALTYYYEQDAAAYATDNNLKTMGKHLVVSIDRSDYGNAKTAL